MSLKKSVMAGWMRLVEVLAAAWSDGTRWSDGTAWTDTGGTPEIVTVSGVPVTVNGENVTVTS